jgi:hypothetical protein
MNRKESSNRSPNEGGSTPSTRIEDSSELPKKRKTSEGDSHGKLRPKRPLTGYNRFFKEERVRWKKEQSNSKMPEVSSLSKAHTFLTMGKEISARWVRLPREQKEKYNAEYDKEMLQYRIDVEKYNRKKEGKTAPDSVAEGEENKLESKERGAHVKTSIDSSAPGPSSQGSFATNALLPHQMLTNNMASQLISSLGTGTSFTELALNQLYQQHQFEMFLQQRLLERQMHHESHILALRSLVGGSTVGTQGVPNTILYETPMAKVNIPGTVLASSYAGLLSLSQNVQIQLPDYLLGDLVGTSNPFAALPGPSSNVPMSNVSTRGFEQLLLSSLLQKRAQQQQNHPPSNNS